MNQNDILNSAHDDKNVPVTPMVIPSMGQDDDVLEIIEKRSLLFNKVLSVAIRSTGPNDWSDQGGKPYLEASGAEKCARRFGVSICDLKIEREQIEDEGGKYYIYTCIGKARLGNETIEAVGTCSTRDKFFCTKKGENGERVFKAQQDIDITNIKKKAVTNFRGNAIRQLLGLNKITWETLKEHGISRDGTSKVNFDKGASKAAVTKQAQVAESNAKKPFWQSEYNGKSYINARVGNHFSEEFLLNLGMKQGKKEGLFFCYKTDEIWKALEDEFIGAEEALSMKQEGGAV